MRNNYLHLLFFAFIFLFATYLNAQSISGIVSDAKTQKGINGVNVMVESTYLGVLTDSEGNFELNGLKVGRSYLITFSLLGYESKSVTITFAKDENLNINLSPSSKLLDEVIVQGTRASKQTATTYAELDKEAIKKQNFGQDLVFLLRQTPSVVVNSDAGAGVGYTGVRIRGADATRVNVTINGIPLNDSESHGTFWVNMPDFASSVDNLQVQRGVGTSTNGAGAFGGSINIQTTTLNEDAYGEYSGSYGSFNTWKNTVQFGSGLLNDRFTIDGRLSKITSDGYIDRATSDLKSFFISGAFYGKNSVLRANITSGKEITYQSWAGLPEYLLEEDRTYNAYTYENEVDDYQQDHYQLHYSHQLLPELNLSLAGHYTKGRGFYESYKDDERLSSYGLENTTHFEQAVTEVIDTVTNETIIDTTYNLATRSDLIRRKWLDNDFYGFTYALKYQKSKLNVTLGGAWNKYDGDHFGEVIWAKFMGSNGNIRHRYYDNVGTKIEFNTYLKTEFQATKKLGIFADLQYRQIDYTIVGLEEDRGDIDWQFDYQFFNPKVGLNYRLADNQQLYASFSIANREPTRGNFIDNNEMPESENLQNLEVGYALAHPKYSLQANYYLMNYKNQLVLTGAVNDVGSAIQENVDKSYRTGFELAAQWQILPKLNWSANAAFSINKIAEFEQSMLIFDNWDNYNVIGDTTYVYKDTDIAFSPNLVAGSTLTYEPIKNLEAAFLSKYVGRQFLDNTADEERQIDTYFVNDLRLSYRFKPKFVEEISIGLLVNNLFNTMYEANGGTYVEVFDSADGPQQTNYDWYYPQAGTNILGSFTVRF
ncbi:MAG: TonB-dependent receptor [Chitinophagales bacterium]